MARDQLRSLPKIIRYVHQLLHDAMLRIMRRNFPSLQKVKFERKTMTGFRLFFLMWMFVFNIAAVIDHVFIYISWPKSSYMSSEIKNSCFIKWSVFCFRVGKIMNVGGYIYNYYTYLEKNDKADTLKIVIRMSNNYPFLRWRNEAFSHPKPKHRGPVTKQEWHYKEPSAQRL